MWQFLHFGDLYAKILGATFQVFPAKGFTEFCLELVPERNWVVVVQKDEVITDGEFIPGFEDEPVLDGTGDRANVHDFVVVD